MCLELQRPWSYWNVAYTYTLWKLWRTLHILCENCDSMTRSTSCMPLNLWTLLWKEKHWRYIHLAHLFSQIVVHLLMGWLTLCGIEVPIVLQPHFYDGHNVPSNWASLYFVKRVGGIHELGKLFTYRDDNFPRRPML